MTGSNRKEQMNFTKRVAKLEQLLVPKRRPRIVIRYAGPGTEHFLQPTAEDIADSMGVITLRFVEARDGRPVGYTTCPVSLFRRSAK